MVCYTPLTVLPLLAILFFCPVFVVSLASLLITSFLLVLWLNLLSLGCRPLCLVGLLWLSLWFFGMLDLGLIAISLPVFLEFSCIS